jgi:hypothetical protein
MKFYHSLLMTQLLLVVAFLVPTALSFSLSPALQRSSSCRTHQDFNRLYAGDDDGNNNGTEDGGRPEAEYGVSYIGGDPCGSKYNDDPFDVQVQKPGTTTTSSNEEQT